MEGPTSWNEQSSTLPGSVSCFAFAVEFVISRHLASTAFPFFSFEICPHELHQYWSD